MSPIKLAIVGGGPSAFYVASRLLSLSKPGATRSPNLRIHMYDRLWAPHGLVRYGVAPDHPEVKNCTNKFDAAATDPRFRFFGNVNVGSAPGPLPHTIHLPIQSLFKHYSHLIFATGCTLPTLHSALPQSSRCIPALSIVHWYTQHPSNPPAPPLENTPHVTLIGNGNVSLDIARMLLEPVPKLSKYDVPQPVLEKLSRSQVKHVSIVARRGPLEAAFTMKELRELINLEDSAMVPIDPSLLVPPPDVPLTRQQSRVLQLLQKGSKNTFGTTPKTWSLDFFRSPTGLDPPSGTSSMAHLQLDHTRLDEKFRAVSTGEKSTLPTSLVITSLGFHGEPTAPFYDPALRHLRTVEGRIIGQDGLPMKNMYASGWASTGAKGVLAATMIDAYAVADTLLTDWMPNHEVVKTTPVSPALDLEPEDGTGVRSQMLNLDPDLESVPSEVQQGVSEGVVVEYPDWKKVDGEEIRRGEALGKERERMKWSDAQDFLAQSRHATK